MKNILKILGISIISGIIIFIGINLLLPDKYSSYYEKSLVLQHDYYETIKGNKIVFIGFSPFPFCLDLDLMEKLTNKKCIYISSAIESGMSVLLEISKINLKKGDIVVITIQHADGSVYAYTPSVFRGFGKRLDMYKYLKCPASFTVDEKIKYYKDLSKLYITYLKERINNKEIKQTGAYSIEAFDSKGKFIADRPKCLIYPPEIKEGSGFHYVKYDKILWGDKARKFYQNYAKYCKSKKVKLYFSIVPNYKYSILSSDEDIERYERMLKKELPAPYISKQKSYIFDEKSIYDCPIHCTNEGAKLRTQNLYMDLKPYLD